jgi:para-nitrobenzyl esterase
VVGFRGAYGAHTWLGIPFARAPVGELRWRAPQPTEPWEGIHEATAFGSACSQYATALGGSDGSKAGEPTGSEDCLYLNVYAPAHPPEAVPSGPDRLPVMLWIHGGGNSMGSAHVYEGGNLAATHDVVVVSIHYRLGPFGWFRHPALHGEGTSAEDRSGNFGTLDLVAALRWVRENISAFGGDPGNLTLFGESAGGTNVYTLLLSPRARGLFHRAIVQSGGLGTQTVAEAENFADDPVPGHAASSREAILELLEIDGSAADRAAAKAHLAAMSDSEIARYLRGKSDREILAAYQEWGGTGMIRMPRVFRDGFVLPLEEPRERLAAGRYNRVPVILGTNRDENKLFMSFDPRYVRTVFRLPVWVKDRDRYERHAAYRSQMWKAAAVDDPAADMRPVQGPSVWAYRFDWDEAPRVPWIDLGTLLGAAHAFEIPFVFGHFELGRVGRFLWSDDGAQERLALSAAMMSYWAQFAYAGDPGRGRGGDQAHWKPWRGSGRETFIVFDTPSGGGIRMTSESVSAEGLVARIQEDEGFADGGERCSLLRELTGWSPDFTEEHYARIASCELPPVAAGGD